MRTFLKPLFSLYHWCWALAGALAYQFPSRHLKVIGVTGTKGKSTTLALLAHILERAGHSTAVLSSVSMKVGPHSERNRTGNTMPGRLFIQKFLKQAAAARCEYVLLEVTSQGILQHRHRFIAWDKAVFLDIHAEHIEAHGSFENYLDSKVSFFRYVAGSRERKTPQFFVNQSDPYADHFIRTAKEHTLILFSPDDVQKLEGLSIPDTLEGAFNTINVAAAFAVARSEGVSLSTVVDAINSFSGLAGRMEVIARSPFRIVVDYAHTPDSLRAVYGHLVATNPEGARLICVLGSCGGGRDKWKRPELGKIAAQNCNTVILTNEDPFDEPPEQIIEDIAAGCAQIQNSKSEILKIVDRKEAIQKAIALAREGDTIVITGKGAEEYIRVKGGKKIPWSDAEAVRELMGDITK